MDLHTDTKVRQPLWICDGLGSWEHQVEECIQLECDAPIQLAASGEVKVADAVEVLLDPTSAVRLLEKEFDYLIVHVTCAEIEDRKDTFWCEAQIAPKFSKKAFFESHRRAHSFLIPINLFCGSSSLPLVVTASEFPDDSKPAIRFPLTISAAVCRRDSLYSSFAKNAVFVFSTARSGSTWLASDILCWGRKKRVVDEPGYGMLFAPIRWDAERFFDLAKCNTYIPSGLEYEMGIKRRTIIRNFPGSDQHISVFDRYNADLQGPAGLFNPAYRDHFSRMIRSAIIEHALDVWGARDFTRVIFKMPNESHAADFILAAMPEAKVIHLVRDGRDVMSSRFGRFGSGILSTAISSDLRRHAISFYSHFWNFQNDVIADACRRHAPERTMFVRYEDLRNNLPHYVSEIYQWLENPLTQEDMRALAQDVDLANAPRDEVGYGKRRGDGALGRFKSIFSDDEVELMNTIMGPALARYGYGEIS